MSNLNFLHSGGNKVTLSAPASNPSSDVNFKLPQTDGSAGQVLKTDGNGYLSWVSLPASGLQMADQWRRTATLNTNGAENFITTDWNRVSGGGLGTLGTGMSESGGIFTFPSTGIYLVTWQAYAETSSTSGVNAVNIYITTDNNTYVNRASSLFSMEYDMSGYNYGNGHVSAMIDVTNVSNVKLNLEFIVRVMLLGILVLLRIETVQPSFV